MNRNTDYVDLDYVDAAIDALELAERKLKACTERGHSEGDAAAVIGVVHDQTMDDLRCLLALRARSRTTGIHRADQ